MFNNLKPQQRQTSTTPTSEARQNEKKKQNRRPQPPNHTKDPPTFFGTMRLFETFWIEYFSSKDPPFSFFDVLQHNGCQKIAKGPPFYIFWRCDTVQKSHKKFFLGNFFMSPKGLKIFCNQLEFHKARIVPLLNFEL